MPGGDYAPSGVATFVLIHMACAGGWAWGRVPDLLREAGHDAIAPDLDLVRRTDAADPCRRRRRTRARERDSGARGSLLRGMVLPPLAAHAASRGCRRLIVLDGFMPDDGESVFALRSPEIAARTTGAGRRARRRALAAAGRVAGRSRVDDRLVPMPLSAFEEPVRVPPSVAALPGTFIRCTRSDMGAQAARARARGWPVLEVEATHFVPLTRPEACARALLDAATGQGRGRR